MSPEFDPSSFGDTDAVAVCIAARGPVNALTEKECAGLAVMLHGDPGCGKSDISAHVGKRFGYKPYRIALAAHGPEDIGGLPMPVPYLQAGLSEREQVAVFKKAVWNRFVEAKANHGIIIFEDITAATPAVAKAALQVVLERQLDDFSFEGVPIILTGNIDAHTVTSTLNPALANRMAHLRFRSGPSGDAFKYRTTGRTSQLHLSVEKLQILASDDKIWEDYLHVAQVVVSQYQEKRQEKAYEWEPEGSAENQRKSGAAASRTANASSRRKESHVPMVSAGQNPLAYAYPTDRSYELLERMLAACFFLGVEGPGLQRMITSCVGEVQGKEIFKEIQGKKRPTMSQVLEGKDLTHYNPAEVVMTLRACAENIEPQQWEPLKKAMTKYFRSTPNALARIRPSMNILADRMGRPINDEGALPTDLLDSIQEFRNLMGGKEGLDVDAPEGESL